MKILVDKNTDTIVGLSYDIEEQVPKDNENDLHIFILKDKQKNTIKRFKGEYYIFDTGDDSVIEKELMEADLSDGLYCIQDGDIVLKNAYSLNEIRKVKREVEYIKNTLEINQLELLYELSLLQLGL